MGFQSLTIPPGLLGHCHLSLPMIKGPILSPSKAILVPTSSLGKAKFQSLQLQTPLKLHLLSHGLAVFIAQVTIGAHR